MRKVAEVHERKWERFPRTSADLGAPPRHVAEVPTADLQIVLEAQNEPSAEPSTITAASAINGPTMAAITMSR